jgi:hypothetical protein
MKYRPMNDAIDPEMLPGGFTIAPEREHDPDAPNDAYVMDENGATIQAPDADSLSSQQSGPKPWAKPLAALLGVLFVALTFWNLTRFIQGPPPPPKPTPVQVKQALYLGVMKVDAYRRTYGVVPDQLSDAGLPDTGPYTYQRLDQDHYQLAFTNQGEKLEYDSHVRKDSFFGSPKELLSMGAEK